MNPKKRSKKGAIRSMADFEREFLPRTYEEKLTEGRDQEYAPLGFGFITRLSRQLREGLTSESSPSKT